MPKPYAALVSAMVIAAETPNGQPPEFRDVALAGLGLQDGVKGWFFTGVGLVVAQKNRSIHIGDIEVIISINNKDEFGTTQITNSQYLFNSSSELKTEVYWQPIAIPNR